MKHIDFSSRQTKMRWLIGTLAVILFFALITVRVFHPRFPMRFPNQLQHKVVLAPENIQGWMTFEYLNFVFRMPPGYLRETLGIQDTKYPKISLKRYAEKSKMNVMEFVQAVQEAVRNHKP